MDVDVAARYSSSNSNPNSQSSGDKTSTHKNSGGGSGRHHQHHHNARANPATPNKHVNFSGHAEEKKREKFLTAKYGAHQMALIRKRLRVEMWMYERLQELYGADDIEIDLDEVLDLDSEMERRQYINSLLRDSPAETESVKVFVGDLLEKVKTL